MNSHRHRRGSRLLGAEPQGRGFRAGALQHLLRLSCYFCQKELYSNCHNTNLEATALGGVYGVGVYGPTFNAVPIGNVVNKGLTIRANQASVKRHLPRLIEHVQAGRVKPSEIITHRFGLEDIADAYHIFSSKLDGCIKPVLVPPTVH